MKAHRVSGPAWWLAMLWAGLGVAGSAYAFVWSLQPVTNSAWGDFIWAGEPAVLSNAAGVGAAAWFLLAIPVLIAGLVRLFRRKPGRGRVAAWVTTWVASVALMIEAAYWAGFSPRTTYPCAHWGRPSWCSFDGWGPSIVIWGELPICAAFLALGAVETWILAGQPSRSLERQAGANSSEDRLPRGTSS